MAGLCRSWRNNTESWRTARTPGRRERLFLQGMEGQLLSGGHEAGGHARLVCRAPADGGDQQHVLSDAQGRGARELGADRRPRSFRFAIKASRRITHMARLKADSAADSVAYLYRTSRRSGAKRGPVLFQLPPFLKKDLPRLTEFLHAAARRPPRRVRVPQRELVRRRRLRRAQARRRRALPVRARRQRAAAAGGDRALGLRAAAARELLRRAICSSGRERLAATAWQQIYVYFMHEPTAPAYAQTLMRHCTRKVAAALRMQRRSDSPTSACRRSISLAR